MSETLEVAATGAAAEAIRTHVPVLVADGFAGKLFAQDATLWGPEAEEESAKRLSWVGLPRTSRHLVGEVSALRSELQDAGVDHVVLCGMGGSSLAPEVICASYGVELTVLDSSSPDQVREALGDRVGGGSGRHDLERLAHVASCACSSWLLTVSCSSDQDFSNLSTPSFSSTSMTSS